MGCSSHKTIQTNEEAKQLEENNNEELNINIKQETIENSQDNKINEEIPNTQDNQENQIKK